MFAAVNSKSAHAGQADDRYFQLPLRGTVLLIDDEEVIRDIGCEMLHFLGLDCIPAANGHEGLALFRENASDIRLVILDVEMPGLSGEKVFRALQEMNPGVPVLIASGYSQGYLESKVFKGKIPHFIPKPFSLEHLVFQIQRMFASENVR